MPALEVAGTPFLTERSAILSEETHRSPIVASEESVKSFRSPFDTRQPAPEALMMAPASQRKNTTPTTNLQSREQMATLNTAKSFEVEQSPPRDRAVTTPPSLSKLPLKKGIMSPLLSEVNSSNKKGKEGAVVKNTLLRDGSTESPAIDTNDVSHRSMEYVMVQAEKANARRVREDSTYCETPRPLFVRDNTSLAPSDGIGHDDDDDEEEEEEPNPTNDSSINISPTPTPTPTTTPPPSGQRPTTPSSSSIRKLRAYKSSPLSRPSLQHRRHLLTQIKPCWNAPLPRVLPRDLWIRDSQRHRPAHPIDWATPGLEKLLELAERTRGAPECAVEGIRVAVGQRGFLSLFSDVDVAMEWVQGRGIGGVGTMELAGGRQSVSSRLGPCDRMQSPRMAAAVTGEAAIPIKVESPPVSYTSLAILTQVTPKDISALTGDDLIRLNGLVSIEMTRRAEKEPLGSRPDCAVYAG